METNLELQDITYQYDSGNKAQIVLRNLSYTFSEGTFYTILGPSGAGKQHYFPFLPVLINQPPGN